jgi:hypothetical protein
MYLGASSPTDSTTTTPQAPRYVRGTLYPSMLRILRTSGGSMGKARAGRKWLPAEEDMLLDELCGESTLVQVAARHKRSPGAIASRLNTLLAPHRAFEGHDDLFAWARSEIRKGRSGSLGWAWDRATAAAGSPVPGRSATTAGSDRGWTSARIRPATATRRAEVIALWSSMRSAASCADSGVERPHGEELDVLAVFDDARLQASGTAVLAATGELRPALWVLEADWPGIQRLTITAEQISAGGEDVQQAGADLLVAGLGHSRERDREIMQMRLGFTGDAMSLAEVAERYWLSRERIRQIQAGVIKDASVGQQAGVRRCWHHVHDMLRAALTGSAGHAQLDPDLVLSFVELVTPAAPREVAVSLVASLCGLRAEDARTVVAAVQERYEDRVRLRQQQAVQEKTRGQLTAKIQRLIARSEWPAAGSGTPDRRVVSPQRDPGDDDGRSRSGYWMSPRLGRKVGYDSGAELQVFQLLDAADDLVESYCEQPVVIPYQLDGRQRRYFPDVLVDFRDGRRLLIEVKARWDDFAVYENVVKFQAAREYCRARGWGFIACTDRIQTAQDLLLRPVADGVEEALRVHLAAGPTDWSRVEPLTREYDMRYSDVATLALRNGWCWRKGPFRLSSTPYQG